MCSRSLMVRPHWHILDQILVGFIALRKSTWHWSEPCKFLIAVNLPEIWGKICQCEQSLKAWLHIHNLHHNYGHNRGANFKLLQWKKFLVPALWCQNMFNNIRLCMCSRAFRVSPHVTNVCTNSDVVNWILSRFPDFMLYDVVRHVTNRWHL